MGTFRTTVGRIPATHTTISSGKGISKSGAALGFTPIHTSQTLCWQAARLVGSSR